MFTKFTKAEDFKVASPEDHEEIEGQLRQFGVKSVANLSADSKKKISKTLDSH